jgi:CDP-6-deoxy-D-xylo-4-hexulose-3-dehydrase
MVMRRIQIGDFVLGDEERGALHRVIASNRISEGPEVKAFERGFSKYIGMKRGVMTNSGTSALLTGLMAMRYAGVLDEGDRVLTTPLTYAATSNAIVAAGLEPIYVDVDPDTFGMLPELALEEAHRVSLILPVHLMGYPVDIEAMHAACLPIFEDSAQAHGSLIHGKTCGSLGMMSAYSFYIAHNIQLGEAGMLLCNDHDLADVATQVKANGRACTCHSCTRSKGLCPKSDLPLGARFTHEYVGYNFKSNELMGAIGNVQLTRLRSIIEKRNENVKYLNEGLSSVDGEVKLPIYDEDVSYLGYPLIALGNHSRSIICRFLERAGIETRPLFGCLPFHQPAYSHLREVYDGKLPNAKYLGEKGFYIGCHQFLTDDDLDYVIRTIKEILR